MGVILTPVNLTSIDVYIILIKLMFYSSQIDENYINNVKFTLLLSKSQPYFLDCISIDPFISIYP